MAVRSQTGPSRSRGVPCPMAKAQQRHKGAGGRLCAGQDVPWHSPRPPEGQRRDPPPAPQRGPLSPPATHRARPLQPVCASRSPPRGWRWRPPGAGAGAVWTWCSSGSWGGTGNPVLTIQPLRDFLRFLPSLPVPVHGAAAGTRLCHCWAAPSPAAPPAASHQGSGPAGAQGSSSPPLWSITPGEPELSPVPTGVSPHKAPSAMPCPACPPAPLCALCAPASPTGCRDWGGDPGCPQGSEQPC